MCAIHNSTEDMTLSIRVALLLLNVRKQQNCIYSSTNIHYLTVTAY